MAKTFLFAGALTAFALAACQSAEERTERRVVSELEGGVNPYLWRASLDTLDTLPLTDADPVGGIINYDWRSFPSAENERLRATVYILDTRLRADGVKVAVFRQTRAAPGGDWVDADTDPATPLQLENKILERARSLKATDVS